MVDEVIDSMIQEQMRYAGQTDEAQVKEVFKTKTFRKELRQEAKMRARNTLILWQVSKQEEIEINDEDLKSHIVDAYLGNIEDAEKKRKWLTTLVQASGAKIKENLTLEKALGLFIDKAEITEVPTGS